MTITEAIEELKWIRREYAQTDEEWEALTIAIRKLEEKDEC